MFQVTAQADQPRLSTPNSAINTPSSDATSSNLTASLGLSGMFGHTLPDVQNMLSSLQAFHNPQTIQQLQQFAIMQAAGPSINHAQLIFQNQVIQIFAKGKTFKLLLSSRGFFKRILDRV